MKLLKPLDELETVLEQFPVFAKGWDFDVDISEDKDNIIVEMHVAGVKPDNIDIEVNENMLRVSGQREEEKEKAGRHYFRKEIERGSFERILMLPADVEANSAAASYADGVLKIVLHKEKTQKMHKVKVESH